MRGGRRDLGLILHPTGSPRCYGRKNRALVDVHYRLKRVATVDRVLSPTALQNSRPQTSTAYRAFSRGWPRRVAVVQDTTQPVRRSRGVVLRTMTQ